MADPDNYPDSEEDDKGIMQPQSSLVVLDQYTGAIQAIVGGREHYQKMGLNRAADSKRQPGSTFKPITVYSTALSMGYPASYIIDDSPMSPAETGSKSWLPTNHTGKYEGLMTMRRAVQTSCNVAAVRMGMQIGIEPMFEMGQNMGLKSLIGEGSSTDKGYAPLCLGGLTYGVTNVELASAYGTIANGGTYIEPYAIERITDKEGKVIYEADPEIVEGVLTEEVSWLLTDVLKSVVSSGTGSKAKFGGWDVAGKTGTTNARKDVWFAGFTNRYVCTVWIGCDQPTPMTGASVWGSTYCAPMWKSVMIAAHEGLEAEKFAKKPEGVIGPIAVDGVSGKLPTQYSSLDPRGSKVYSEYYLKGTQPVLADDVHVAYDICTESGLLANEFCPDALVETKVFINRPDYYLGELKADGTYKSKGEPEDAQYMPPTEVCTVHTFLDNGSIIIPIEPTVPENPDDPGWTEVPSEGETTPEEVTTPEVTTPAVTEPEVVTPAA